MKMKRKMFFIGQKRRKFLNNHNCALLRVLLLPANLLLFLWCHSPSLSEHRAFPHIRARRILREGTCLDKAAASRGPGNGLTPQPKQQKVACQIAGSTKSIAERKARCADWEFSTYRVFLFTR
jgi:hypothetical protein